MLLCEAKSNFVNDVSEQGVKERSISSTIVSFASAQVAVALIALSPAFEVALISFLNDSLN